jgi:hypothetical protein
MGKKKICLVSGEEIRDTDNYFHFRIDGINKKFYVIRNNITGKEKYAYFQNLALKHPERGSEYEIIGKDRLENILWKSMLNNFAESARKQNSYAM